MADTKALRFDDFVSAARSDPDRPQPLIMLTGYVGRSDVEGRLRIYADASLNSWIDAAEDDVVHSTPIADSPLGGSHVWLRGTAKVTSGVASVPKPEPGEDEEADGASETAPQPGADTGMFNPLAANLPTLFTQLTCPRTYACLPQAAAPTFPECTILCTPTLPPQCGPARTRIGCLPTHLGGCPSTSVCPPLADAAGANISYPGCVPTARCVADTVLCTRYNCPGAASPHTMEVPCTRTTCPPKGEPLPTRDFGCVPTFSGVFCP